MTLGNMREQGVRHLTSKTYGRHSQKELQLGAEAQFRPTG
jgi:hypothetical protein